MTLTTLFYVSYKTRNIQLLCNSFEISLKIISQSKILPSSEFTYLFNISLWRPCLKNFTVLERISSTYFDPCHSSFPALRKGVSSLFIAFYIRAFFGSNTNKKKFKCDLVSIEDILIINYYLC